MFRLLYYHRSYVCYLQWIKMMWVSKGILTPLIPNCYVLCTLAILKTFVIRSFFFKKWLLTHVFGGSQVQKSSCKQACIGFMTFWPWYQNIRFYYLSTLYTARSFKMLQNLEISLLYAYQCGKRRLEAKETRMTEHLAKPLKPVFSPRHKRGGSTTPVGTL